MLAGNFVIAFVLSQYTLFFLSLINKNKKLEVINKNKRIENLRTISNKTIKQQKEFLSLRYGTGETEKLPFKIKLKNWLKYALIFLIYFTPLYYSGVRFPFWITLLISIIIGLIINKILTRFNLQRQDGIDVLFK